MSGYESKSGRVYISGTDRSQSTAEDREKKATHLFDGDFGDPGLPLCKWAYDPYGGYSIFRNNVTAKGYCKICKRRADLGLNGVVWDYEEQKT